MFRSVRGPLAGLLAGSLLWLTGCSSGTTPGTTIAVPTISSEPANLSIPMGLAGTVVVVATGTGLQYQWSRNGAPISGATGSSYTTPLTVFSDTGALFTVTVRNSAGSVTSTPALLTVTARAPRPGDLRFQQVDAASTVNGFVPGPGLTNVFCPAAAQGGIAAGSFPATGTQFALSNISCSDHFLPWTTPSADNGLEVAYANYPMQSYASALNQNFFLTTPATPSDPGSVIFALDINATIPSVAFGFIHDSQGTGFDRTEYVVNAADLQAAASREGMRGRVITAISYDGQQADFFSYGWTGDPGTVYESQVVFATQATTPDSIVAMANAGYILTASGTTHAADGSGVVLVGTRVLGDTMPRPVMAGDLFSAVTATIMTQGYAVVATTRVYQGLSLTTQKVVGER